MSIGEVQSRIAHIQSMMAVATAARPATVAPTAAPAAGTAAAGSSATQFAAALQQASAAAGTGAPTGAAGAPAAGSGAVTAAGWTVPAKGRVSSTFGPRWGAEHQGIDIAAGTGTPVTAAAGGVVRKASWYGGYGNAVIVDHGNGVQTLYGHNSKLTVKPGDTIKAGQKIAEIGSTGDSTGPHLHFEVQVNGKKVDPRPWLKERGVTL